MHPQGQVVGNRVYYGNYRGNACSPQNRTKCLLIFFTIMFVLVGLIVTIIGFTLKPFWDDSNDWCSFCKEENLATKRNTANCRIVGPIFLGIGVLLIIITCCYSHKTKNEGTVLNTGGTSAATTMTTTTYNQGPQTTTTYPGSGATIHPPPQQPQQYPAVPPFGSQPYPPQTNPSQPYRSQPYPPQPNASQPYPSQPYPPQGYPPPPTYNDATTGNIKS